jgi:hypothetical protein
MSTTGPITRVVDDLAAHWTDPVLEILKVGGIGNISVEMELATWRTLKEVLNTELRWQRSFRVSTLAGIHPRVDEQVHGRGASRGSASGRAEVRASIGLARGREPDWSVGIGTSLDRGGTSSVCADRSSTGPACRLQGAEPNRFRAAPANCR